MQSNTIWFLSSISCAGSSKLMILALPRAGNPYDAGNKPVPYETLVSLLSVTHTHL